MPKKRCPHCSEGRSGDFPLSENVVNGTILWHCHRCGYSGSNKEKGALSVEEHPNIVIKPKVNASLVSEHADYLASRGISRGTAEKFRLYSDGGDIIYPYHIGSDLVNQKYRSVGGKRFRMEKGGKLTLFNYNGIDNDCTILTEGENDSLAIAEATGRDNVVSVPNGANSSFWNEELTERFRTVKTVVLALDNDEKGVEFEEKISNIIGKEKCKKVEWPEGCKDANDVLVKHGSEDLKFCIENAKYYPMDGILTPSTTKIFDYYEGGEEKGLSTGIHAMDKILNFESDNGQLILLTGYPGMGKSQFADQLINNTAIRHGWRWGVYSPESFPPEYYLGSMAARYWGKPFLKGFTRQDGTSHEYEDRLTLTELKEAVAWQDEYLSLIDDDGEKPMTVDRLISKIRYLKATRGIRAALIDPFNALVQPEESRRPEVQWITEELHKLKMFVLANKITLLICVHPRKPAQSKNGDDKYQVIKPHELKGSSGFWEKACVIMSLHRPNFGGPSPECNEVEVHVQKCKKRYLGKVGSASMIYNFKTGEVLDG